MGCATVIRSRIAERLSVLPKAILATRSAGGKICKSSKLDSTGINICMGLRMACFDVVILGWRHIRKRVINGDPKVKAGFSRLGNE